ncbi:unnamed protein product, partial [Staurois parvus]
MSQHLISPHCLGNSSLGSVRVWIHHPPLTATVTRHCQPQIQSIPDTDYVFNIGAGGILWH